MKRIHLMFAATALLALSGCATLSAPRPAPDDDPTDPRVIAVQTGGDLGAVTCTGLMLTLKPNELEQARKATAAAQTVMKDNPSFPALEAALSQGVPEQYARAGAALLSRLRKRLGNAEIIPTNSTGFALVEEYLNECAILLGPPGMTAAVDIPITHWLPPPLGEG